MKMFSAGKVCVAMVLFIWVCVDAQTTTITTESTTAVPNVQIDTSSPSPRAIIYPYPTKPDKWSKECDTIADCPKCQSDLKTICVSGYCGCKNRYNFGG